MFLRWSRSRHHSSFCIRAARRDAALSLVEILIAMFIFLFGIVGVLSMFPVAMNNAGRVIGETRATLLARSALAQFTADCTVAYERGDTGNNSLSATQARELLRATSTQNFTGYFVTLTKQDGSKQCRLITGASGSLLQVCPDWTVVPVAADHYVITRLGLPDPRREDEPRGGYVREMQANGVSFQAGTATSGEYGTSVAALPWVTHSWAVAASGPFAANAGSVAGDSTVPMPALPTPGTLPVKSVAWTNDEHRGRLVVIGGATSAARGQVRLIVSNTANELRVFPGWSVVPTENDPFEIRPSLGYMVLFTNGRAAGRVAGITAHASDTITCAGADLVDFGVADAKIAGSPPTYELRYTSAFQIIGSNSFLGTAHPHFTESTHNPHAYWLNAFGVAKSADAAMKDQQTGPDIFFAPTEQSTSEYSTVCIFSNNGQMTTQLSDAADGTDWARAQRMRGCPVRIDVLVFRNYDRTKTPVENRRPVGHITGYIGRP